MTLSEQKDRHAMPTPHSTTNLPATATYAEAYAKLAAIAAKLKAPVAATSIDTLAQDVRDARAAHAICKSRLAAIRGEIENEDLETI
ncbi:hypothetical protein P7D22_20085 [Lichenihabitans sp. Uapishka_5]|uniref:hypothetical protein n=1 Tax=Lichenihabitans sp. Uapishka_5 TaxID=3037302 RepID=UPI0029E7F599|nr:hypothetical protein [Lichenihabitans sp. Uapishka_5]MDX7953468.1 hypothetical protein [Lichenihabitans sp. Uapishka_5]